MARLRWICLRRKPAEGEVKLLTLTEGRTIPLNPPTLAASEDSSDSIDKLFDEGDDAEQGHSIKRDDDVPREIITKDISEVAVEKTKKKQKRKATEDASGFAHPPKKLKEDHYATAPNISGKSLAAIHGLMPKGSGVPSGVTEPLVVAFVTPTSELNLSPAADAPVMTVMVTTTIAANVSTVPPPKVRVELRNLEVFRDSTSVGGFNADAPKVRMQVEYTLEKKGELEDKCAEQAALLSEKDTEIANLKSLLSLKEAEVTEAVRLRGQLSIVETADAAKGHELKGLKEKNLALEEDKNVLSEKVTTFESVTAVKEAELASLSAQVAKLTSDLSDFQLSCDELSSKVASLESEKDSLVNQRSSLKSAFKLFKEQIEAMQDKQATTLGNRVAELDVQLLEMSTEYLRVLGGAIGCAVNKGMQDGLAAGIDHGKAGRDLSMIEAYDPSTSKKDASIVDLMDSIRLEGPLAEIHEAAELQPSPKQLMLPIYRPKDDVVLGETSLSFSLQVLHSRVQRVKGEIIEKRLSLTDVMAPLAEPLSLKSLIGEANTSTVSATAKPVTTLSTTFSSFDVVPPFSVFDYQVLDAKPHAEDPPALTFEEEKLDTTPE
ncbi:hypothetical protein Tco_0709391 [Tanacetum coccineum]